MTSSGEDGSYMYDPTHGGHGGGGATCTNDDNNNDDNNANDDWDARKVFVSRVPAAFDSDTVRRIFEEKFGPGSVEDVSIVGIGSREEEKEEEEEDKKGEEDGEDEGETTGTSPAGEDHRHHRGFGFVTFFLASIRDKAIEAGTVRGGAKETSKRKQTMYIRPLDRSLPEEDDGESSISSKNVCHLWPMKRCPYGSSCKFLHVGEGGCVDSTHNARVPLSKAERDKKKKCFSFKKKGKCAKGDGCPFSHDVLPTKEEEEGGNKQQGRPPSEKDCINWKKKGKCRKLNSKGGCPYRHDLKLRDAALAKKANQNASNKRKHNNADDDAGTNNKKAKVKQPLCVRVFGMNYDTKEEDIRSLFGDCGPIVEITFPTFEDSGRSKGYCGILFQSPKAVEKALLLHETELHGRWLSVQAGKMMLKQWEARERQSRGEKSTGTGGDVDNESKCLAAKVAAPEIGEFGQKVKKRKAHGYKDEQI